MFGIHPWTGVGCVGRCCHESESDRGQSARLCHRYVANTTAKTLPIKWTAPEALLRGEFTLATDVWAYGVLLWEIFSGGVQPYLGMTNAKARNAVVKAGFRMASPKNCPVEVYQMMQEYVNAYHLRCRGWVCFLRSDAADGCRLP